MRIVIDAMGGDHAPDEIVSGAIEAARQIPDATLLLVGQKERLAAADLPRNAEIVHASEVIGMDEDPARALLSKRDSSLHVAMSLVKRGEADAIVSAGNTGALVGGATLPVFGLGRLPGVKRAGIAIPFPSESGTCALIDAGANPTARAEHLIQYAIMGAVYIRYLRPDIKTPRVGLLNIGEEPKKGTDVLRETFNLLKRTQLNFDFVGNIEPHRQFSGIADVVVCDGFVGNLMLKMAEGVKGFILRQFSNGLASSPDVQAGVMKATEKFDYTEFGGAPLLGVRGIVIKAHGRSKAKAITNAIKLTGGFVRDKLNDHIVDELRKVSETWGTWFAKWFSWSKEEE